MATLLKAVPEKTGRWVVEDRSKGVFKVAREAFVSDAIFEKERERIFDKCWLYLGHATELKKANDYLTRNVAGRELIFNRDRKGSYNAFFNVCPHRGAMVAREKCGSALGFKCFYHGWAFNNNGKFATRMGEGFYPEDFGKDGSVDLVRVPRLEEYRGFYFINFDEGAVSLEDYLADSREIIDLVADQSPNGMEIIGGGQQYSINANWKLLLENSFDGYHAEDTHATYFEYLSDYIGGAANDDLSAAKVDSRAIDLKNGHAVIEGKAPWGRPIARTIPSWGEDGAADIRAARAELEARLGVEKAHRIADADRNMGIFPSLVINDIMAITIRTFHPVSSGLIHVNAWAMGPVGESRVQRKRRLDNFLEFLGPGGFATPDDVEALESAHRGYGNAKFAPWNDISRGLLKDQPTNFDEEQMRCFWREWARRMEDQ
jgi:p-cumate 2,3-dioxygenase alpha subunit